MRTITIESKAHENTGDVGRDWVNNGLTRVGAVLGKGVLSNLATVRWHVEQRESPWDVMTFNHTERYPDPAFTGTSSCRCSTWGGADARPPSPTPPISTMSPPTSPASRRR